MSDVVWIHSEEEFNRVLLDNKHVVADFTAPSWCGPCIQFAPHYERAAENVDGVVFLAIDIDTNPWVHEHEIKSVPTVRGYFNGSHNQDFKAPVPGIKFIGALNEWIEHNG